MQVQDFIAHVGKGAAMAFFKDSLTQNFDYERRDPEGKTLYLRNLLQIEYSRWLSPESDIPRWQSYVDSISKSKAMEQLEICSNIIRLSDVRSEWNSLLRASDPDVERRRRHFISKNLLLCSEDLGYLTGRVIALIDIL